MIGEAQSDPTFAKLIANSYDQEQMLTNDLTSAQVQAGAMEGRRDFAGENIAGVERGNVATEQALRTGTNQGQRDAAQMLGLAPQETARRIGFINALSGEARSSAISQLSRATGRNEAQVLHALETYNAATQVGTADGASAEGPQGGHERIRADARGGRLRLRGAFGQARRTARDRDGRHSWCGANWRAAAPVR